MKHEMSHKEELQQLKSKTRAIQARLDFMEIRIGQIRQRTPATSQWKAFVDAEKCVGCGICQETCPVGAIIIEEIARVDAEKCIGCGHCFQECPKGAISLRPSSLIAQYQIRSWKRTNIPSRNINNAM